MTSRAAAECIHVLFTKRSRKWPVGLPLGTVAYEPPETLLSPRYSRDCESCPPSGAPPKRHAHRAPFTLPMVAHTPTPTPGGPSEPNGPVPASGGDMHRRPLTRPAAERMCMQG
jgi:hypothetical protein